MSGAVVVEAFCYRVVKRSYCSQQLREAVAITKQEKCEPKFILAREPYTWFFVPMWLSGGQVFS